MAASDEPELYSPEWFRWVDGKYLDPDDPPVRYTKTEPPLPCIWEYRPAFWRPGEAWALIEGQWEQVNSSDVGMNARPVTQADLSRLFPDTPPLPVEEFSARG